ncbi:MAG: methylated-DNA--[protein]-cysteine S-methyltransferase [Actinomycetes bacterium]
MDTPIGPLLIAATEAALVSVSFQAGTDSRGLGQIPQRGVGDDRPAPLEQAVLQLGDYFSGDRLEFDLPLDLIGLTDFRRDVLMRTSRIPFGATLSYGELAAAVGRPGAARAVGTAEGSNPIAIVIPCHRVVRSDGAIGQYGGGSEAKRWLLEHEARR